MRLNIDDKNTVIDKRAIIYPIPLWDLIEVVFANISSSSTFQM